MKEKQTFDRWEDPFEGFAELYELTHGDKEDDLPLYIELAKKTDGKLLEIGCGTGRVTIALAKEGYEMVGIDVSEDMLKIARRKLEKFPELQKKVHFLQQNMIELDLPFKNFALALMPYGEFAHVYHRVDQEKTLSNIYHHLKPGGILVIGMSNWDPQEPRINYRGGSIARLGHSMPLQYEGIFEDKQSGNTIIRYIARGYDPSLQMSIHVYVHEITDAEGRLLGKKTNVLPIRYVFRYEMEMLLEKAGFIIKNIYGFYDKSDFRYDSKRMIFIAQKPL
jgi:ubiquinone/menaquinone biosynthesis C-methylase UbiE